MLTQAFYQLRVPATRTLLKTGGKIDFEFGIGQDNRANITPDHDDMALLSQGTLEWSHDCPNLWMCRDGRDGPCDGRTANIPRDIMSAHGHGILTSIIDLG